MFCREQVARLASRAEDISGRGARLVAIGSGTAPFAQAFLDEMPVEFPVYTDPGRRTFAAFAMRRSRRGVLAPSTWKNAARAMKNGHHQSAVRGDPWQDGGVVVVRRGGQMGYRHIEQRPGDLADLDAVIASLE